ncbi:hypothetical protein L1987_41645 [Smallanthus sonchifolius]|uniref:Uncharacterized protein n=1 Tax=Smallanthus sonchifolius TaxID=185202 RepID=A0ACB9GUI7_9ASTR|nr:hypothetical protein L1987_41645 [Smallanthus sonchifolius]
MSSDHQDTRPPTTTTEFHRQQSPSTAGNNHLTFTKPLPHTPPPMTPINPTETNSTPESRLAAALGRAFFNIPPSSFQDAAAATTTTTNPLLRTLSDTDSSANQTTTTPPKVPRNSPLRRTLSDTITTDYEQTGSKNPLRWTLSDTSDNNNNQQPQKTPRVSSSPQSEIVMKKVEDMVREIEQRCWEIMREEEEVHHAQPQQQEECVGVERLKNGDLRFELSCCCGKRFEMLIKHNGYCFYRLT